MKYEKSIWDLAPIVKTDNGYPDVFWESKTYGGPLRYVLLKILCPRIYTQVARETGFSLTYEGMFIDLSKVYQYVEEKELGADFTSRSAEPGISILTVGNNPDYYAVLDLFRLPPDIPQLIGRVSAFM